MWGIYEKLFVFLVRVEFRWGLYLGYWIYGMD